MGKKKQSKAVPVTFLAFGLLSAVIAGALSNADKPEAGIFTVIATLLLVVSGFMFASTDWRD